MFRLSLAAAALAAVSAHGPHKEGWVKPPTPEGVIAFDLPYSMNGLPYSGYVAYPIGASEATDAPPSTLLAHQWYGLGDMERFRCEELAATLKWPCFALDVYGTGVRPSTDAEAAATMDELTSNPTELHARIQSSLDALLSLPTTCAAAGLGNSTCPNVDAARTTANGYCFGGQMVLELARFGGAEVAAVTSFHGELDNLTATPPNIQAVVSVHHAQLDFQGDEALRTFETEMEANAVAHWFTKYYGNVEHGWTDPSLDVYAPLEGEVAHRDMYGTYNLIFPSSDLAANGAA